MIDKAVDNYLERNFTNLMVCFGCTGGRHRSVYFANKLAEHLKKRANIHIVLRHVEMEIQKDG
jgi:RNase adaptor protein for sRNA GlmZ degradation